MVKLLAWNIARRAEPWHVLASSDVDVALLSEATPPPSDLAAQIEVDPSPWHTEGDGSNRAWKACVVRLSDRVSVEWLSIKSIAAAGSGEVAVSRLGTLAAGIITPDSGQPFVVVSIYALWERSFAPFRGNWIYADASVHRLISDLSVFIGTQQGHRILVAGDLNILYGYGEHGSPYWARRYETVFSRMEALGLPFVGPQAPRGRQASPWPAELPSGSRAVPTYHTSGKSPETATRQLDFVFASKGFADNVTVTANNSPDTWGPSDHCRIEIEVAA